jgi:hypothetical protein
MLAKYYSLDECSDREAVSDYLEALEEEGKIYFTSLDEDIIKIDDICLTPKEMKAIIKYFDDNDVIEYTDFDEEDEEDDDDDFDPFNEEL